jgi:anti-anti-sigma factor
LIIQENAGIRECCHTTVIFLRFVSFPDVTFKYGWVLNVVENVMNLEIVDTEDGITNVLLSGRMDVQGALSVDKKFSAIADEKKKVVIDLSEVTFLASLGIRTLIMSCKTLANKGGDMVLLNPQPNVEKVLKTSGVDTVIQIVRDMNQAAAIFSK